MKGNKVEKPPHKQQNSHYFNESERDGRYKTIFNRRDVRSQFKADAIPNDVLSRVLYAAHHAPSVGFMQPWNFLVIKDQAVKTAVHEGFKKANDAAADMFEPEKSKLYRKLKLEGILESPINICITCDRSRTGSVVLGRTTNKEMDLFSTVCAVQNFWLAARAEGLGVVLVSIFTQDDLRVALNYTVEIISIVHLGFGYVSHFNSKTDLQKAGWLNRTPIEDLVFFDQWVKEKNIEEDSLVKSLQQLKEFPYQWPKSD